MGGGGGTPSPRSASAAHGREEARWCTFHASASENRAAGGKKMEKKKSRKINVILRLRGSRSFAGAGFFEGKEGRPRPPPFSVSQLVGRDPKAGRRSVLIGLQLRGQFILQDTQLIIYLLDVIESGLAFLFCQKKIGSWLHYWYYYCYHYSSRKEVWVLRLHQVSATDLMGPPQGGILHTQDEKRCR